MSKYKAWARIGQFLTVVSVLIGAAVGIRQLRSPEAGLSAHIAVGSYETAPDIVRALFPDSTIGLDSLLFVQRHEPYSSHWSGQVTNEGTAVAEDVVLRVDGTRLAVFQNETSPEADLVQGSSFALGRLRPRESAVVRGWSIHPPSSFDKDDAALTHSRGVGKVRVSRPATGSALWVQDNPEAWELLLTYLFFGMPLAFLMIYLWAVHEGRRQAERAAKGATQRTSL